MMEDEVFDMLEEVKNAILMGGNFHDKSIQIWIEEVQDYLLKGGVASSIINTRKCLGVIARGISDLRDYGKFSEYFKERAIQLACDSKTENAKLMELTEALLKEVDADE